MREHGELFESKILVFVQPLFTRLCPLHIQTRIHHNYAIASFNKSLKRCSAATSYCYNKLPCNDISLQHSVLLCEISLQGSLARTMSRRGITKVVPISR